jgi:hypothetical protein
MDLWDGSLPGEARNPSRSALTGELRAATSEISRICDGVGAMDALDRFNGEGAELAPITSSLEP